MIFEIACIKCGEVFQIPMTVTQYMMYVNGDGKVQEIFPELSADMRELLISGICGKCFDDMFK